MIYTYIEVRVPARFKHCWPTAPDHRKYLRAPHPHTFMFRLEIQVFEADREIEFHDVIGWLGDIIRLNFHLFENASCETMAKKVLKWVQTKYGLHRMYDIEVWEDDTCGGKVKYIPDKLLMLDMDKITNVEQPAKKDLETARHGEKIRVMP